MIDKKQKTVTVDSDIATNIINNPEIQEQAVKHADEIAQKQGYDNANHFYEETVSDINSEMGSRRSRGIRAASNFVASLQLVLHEQIILNVYDVEGPLKWVKMFDNGDLKWGNHLQWIEVLTTGAEDAKTDYNPTTRTKNFGQEFYAGFKKPSTSGGDPVLMTNSYQYQKNLSIYKEEWLQHFMSGKLEVFIADLISRMYKSYLLFLAREYQQIFKRWATDGAQVTLANSGENGSATKLRTVEDTTSEDMFAALINFFSEVDDLVNDLNTSSIASDGKNIGAISKSDLVYVIPKKLLAKIKRGVLTRLPTASEFDWREYFNDNNVILAGREIQQVKKAGGNDSLVTISNTPFMDDNQILVFDRRAIQHKSVVDIFDSQYFINNQTQEYVNHIQGFIIQVPLYKGFRFKCRNLLTEPN